jgi:type IV secretory pathway component VirB8
MRSRTERLKRLQRSTDLIFWSATAAMLAAMVIGFVLLVA